MRRIEQYNETYIGRHTPLGLFFKILIATLFVSTIVGASAWACGWVKTGADVVGPTNVKAQWQFAYDYSEKLGAIAGNWCTLRKAEDTAAKAGDANALTQRASQRLATEQNYDRVAAEYNGRLADAFRAKLVKPSDVPDRAPTLTVKLAEIGCTAPAA